MELELLFVGGVPEVEPAGGCWGGDAMVEDGESWEKEIDFCLLGLLGGVLRLVVPVVVVDFGLVGAAILKASHMFPCLEAERLVEAAVGFLYPDPRRVVAVFHA